MLRERVRNKDLWPKIASPREAAELIKDGMNIGTAGGTYTGYPKAVFLALADRGKSGDLKEVNLWSAGLVGEEIDGALSSAGVLKKKTRLSCRPESAEHDQQRSRQVFRCQDRDIFPLDTSGGTREAGRSHSRCGGDYRTGPYRAFELPRGHGKPRGNRGQGDSGDKLRAARPGRGFHDIYLLRSPPAQREVPIYSAADRIGNPYAVVPKEKIACIVGSSAEEKFPLLSPAGEEGKGIARHLITFLKKEVNEGRLPKSLLPIEAGLGGIADAVMRELADSGFRDLEVYTAVLGDGVFDLMERGICRVASGTALYFSRECWDRFCRDIEKYRDRLILRPVDITNHPEVIRRLGVIAINSAVEADIYGHINSSHHRGMLLSGVGGSVAFANNGYVSIFILPSTSRRGRFFDCTHGDPC